jgi:hypothetical protein
MFLNFFGNTVHRLRQDPEAVIKCPLVHLKPCMAKATLCLRDKRKGVDDGLLRAAVALSSASLFICAWCLWCQNFVADPTFDGNQIKSTKTHDNCTEMK